MIMTGVSLIENIHWMICIWMFIVLYKITYDSTEEGKDIDRKNIMIRILRKYRPVVT